jgi:CHAD domain-containing protein
MSFCFKRNESVPSGLKRLAEERVEAALGLLRHHRRPEAVHGVRKDIKKIRAVLRLARERIPKKSYRRQTKLLRKAADRLAGTRDAYVKGTALRRLRSRFQDQLDGRALRPLREQLDTDLAHAEDRFVRKKHATQVRRLLKRIPKELDGLELDEKGWDAISAGVKMAFAAGRQAYFTAQQDPSEEPLHDWRKRVKDLWYQIRVLRPIHREVLDGLAADLKALSEYLGDDHDLYLLRESADGERQIQPELLEPGVLNAMIEQRRRELQAAAFHAGEQIYAEKPAEFCGRLARYWHSWRQGGKPPKAKSVI